MPALLYPVLTEIKTGLQQHYGSRLRGVYLFGSHAAGKHTKHPTWTFLSFWIISGTICKSSTGSKHC